MIEFKCRHCATKYSVKESLAGRRAECKTCGQRFTVPYTSPVVRLGEADLADSRPEEVALQEDDKPFAVSAAPVPQMSVPNKVAVKSPPLLPLPAMVSELWLPLAIGVICFGWAAYASLDYVLRSPGRLGGLAVAVIAAASLLVIAVRLTVRTLEGAAHTFDIEFSNAIVLQTLASVSVPVLGGVLGVLNGGIAGAVVGLLLGLVICLPLMIVLLQMPALKGVQAAVLASIAFAAGFAGSAVLAGASAHVMFTVWSVDLPWQVHTTATPIAMQPPAPAPAVVVPPSAVAEPSPPVTPTPLDSPTTRPVTPTPPAAVVVAVSQVQTPPTLAIPTPTTRPVGPVPAVPPVPPVPAPSPLGVAFAHLMAGSYDQAVVAAKAVQDGLPKQPGRLTDPLLIDSLHIQAVAFMHLGQHAKAAPALQRLVESGTQNRAIVLNHAVCDILLQNPMRAVKNLKAFAASHADDELAISLWGVALDTAARRQKFLRLDDLTNDYLRANTALERSRPGQHHWGTRWVSTFEWQDIERRRTEAVARLTEAKRTLRDATARLSSAEKDFRQTKVIPMGRGFTDDEQRTIARRQREAATRVDTCSAAVSRAKAAVEDAEAQTPRPTWEMDLKPLEPEPS